MSLELTHYPLSKELAEVYKRAGAYVDTMLSLGKKIENIRVFSGDYQKTVHFLRRAGQPVPRGKKLTYRGYDVVDGGPKR